MSSLAVILVSGLDARVIVPQRLENLENESGHGNVMEHEK